MRPERAGEASGDATMRIDDLSVEFRLSRPFQPVHTLRALDRVSLEVAPGEVVGLVGESGSGKTTLGKTILGINRPTEGHIVYRGQDLARLPPQRWGALRRELQMVFQDPLSSFNPRFTIASSVALPLRLHGLCPKDAVPGEVASLLKGVGLTPAHGARYPHELSGGQLQRVAIARALACRPRIIVADEAVSKLDVSVRAQVLNLLKRLNRETGIGLVFITHDLGVARFLCDRIAVMFFGRIVEVGPTEAVFGAPRHPYTRSLLEARTRAGAAVADDAAETRLAVRDPAQACNYAPRCARRIDACLERRPPLDERDARHAVACFVPIERAAHLPSPAPAAAV